MTDTPQYLRIKDHLQGRILTGLYPNGTLLPTEERLRAEFGVSRVTIRKALDLLKREGSVVSTAGQGTMVRYNQFGHTGNMNLVVLVAPIHDPFLAEFYRYFEERASREDCLIVLKIDSDNQLVRSPDFYSRLLQAGIRNFVLWPHQGFSSRDLLECLRGLGANLVFFDHVFETPFADCVTVDNQHGIQSLYQRLATGGRKQIDYLGWSNVLISSTREREDAFLAQTKGAGRVHHLALGPELANNLRNLLQNLQSAGDLPDAFLSGSLELGNTLARVLDNMQLDIPLATMDRTEATDFCYCQPIARLAEESFNRLLAQNRLGKDWRAEVVRLQGTLEAHP